MMITNWLRRHWQKHRRRTIVYTIITSLALCSCCGITLLPEPATAPEPTPTITQRPLPTRPPATDTPPPPPASPTPSPPASPTSSPAAGCTWSAVYIADVTIPDGTRLDPGATFVKTWRIRNAGTCTWGEGEEGVQLAFTTGDQMDAPAAIPIPATAPGDQVDISVPMTAPATPGQYRATWSARQADHRFGQEMTVLITSGSPQPTAPPIAQPTVPPTAPPAAQPTAPPAAVCDCSGNIYNCSDFSTWTAAQACFDYCISLGRGDIHRLDRDNDGIACESLL